MRVGPLVGAAVMLAAAAGGLAYWIRLHRPASGHSSGDRAAVPPANPGQPACRASNFSVPCGADNDCPANSVCQKDHSCSCDDDHIAVDCWGKRCRGDCRYPNWWCEPRTCGRDNFTVRCPLGDGGAFRCPGHGVCADGSCKCADGYVAVHDDGRPCEGDCAFPDWWCVARKPGVCGATNFSVKCGPHDYCPSSSKCRPDGGCDCDPGHEAETCAFEPCSADTPCTFPNWWCH